MQIDVKGHSVPVTDELREHVRKRFATVARQVPVSTLLEIEFSHERNPAIAEPFLATAVLHLKGVTLRASESSGLDAEHAVNPCSRELARQVKRHRDKLRRRREGREPAAAGEVSAAL